MGLSVNELKGIINDAFKQAAPMLSYYQTIADNFYPERANFTQSLPVGGGFFDGLADSNPVLMRRDLGDSLSAMMRDGEWFKLGVKGGKPDYEAEQWLEWAEGRLYELFADTQSNFTGATKDGDHDFVTFGSPVISVERNKNADGLLFRCWHIKDCSWWDDESGQVAGVVRRWNPTLRQMVDIFGFDNVHKKVQEKVAKKPFEECKVVHAVIPSAMCRDPEKYARFPFVSFYLDIENDHILEEVGQMSNMYIIPRFKRFPSTQFAYSPATSTALPDARTGQTMQFTLLEVAERIARPPLVATEKAIRSDIDLDGDGITWVDSEYDERMGDPLRPLNLGSAGGYPVGLDAQQDIRGKLSSAFYTNRLSLPNVDHTMTATEVIERMKQYRRENLPLFQPIEKEYNGQLCEKAFDIAYAAGFFGSPQDVPDSLQGAEIEFVFISPLTEAKDEEGITKLQSIVGIVAQAKEHDPNAGIGIDWERAVADSVEGIGAPGEWMKSPEAIEAQKQAMMMAQIAEAAPQVLDEVSDE